MFILLWLTVFTCLSIAILLAPGLYVIIPAVILGVFCIKFTEWLREPPDKNTK
jgi:hypothetical protein